MLDLDLGERTQKVYLVKIYLKTLHISQVGNGTHFNLSLWDLKGEKNVFHDPDDPDKLSDVCKYFVGLYQVIFFRTISRTFLRQTSKIIFLFFRGENNFCSLCKVITNI